MQITINKEPEVNEKIKDSKVRVINNDGEQLGVMNKNKAIDMAFERGYDLIKVAPNADPSVCKMMDYGKYKYKMAKKAKRAKQNSTTVKTKELRLSAKIQDHDLNTKANKAKDFLKDDNKVKISLRLKGREMGHKGIAFDVVEKFIDFVGRDNCNVAKEATFEGRIITAVIEPKK